MKMNSAQIQQTLHSLNAAQLNAEAIPHEHPMMPQLERLFGDHTYFLDSRGLNIVEPVEAGHDDGRLGVVVNLANWTGSNAESLQPHQPEPTETVVELVSDGHH